LFTVHRVFQRLFGDAGYGEQKLLALHRVFRRLCGDASHGERKLLTLHRVFRRLFAESGHRERQLFTFHRIGELNRRSGNWCIAVRQPSLGHRAARIK
jgi:hypothetical protein